MSSSLQQHGAARISNCRARASVSRVTRCERGARSRRIRVICAAAQERWNKCVSWVRSMAVDSLAGLRSNCIDARVIFGLLVV